MLRLSDINDSEVKQIQHNIANILAGWSVTVRKSTREASRLIVRYKIKNLMDVQILAVPKDNDIKLYSDIKRTDDLRKCYGIVFIQPNSIKEFSNAMASACISNAISIRCSIYETFCKSLSKNINEFTKAVPKKGREALKYYSNMGSLDDLVQTLRKYCLEPRKEKSIDNIIALPVLILTKGTPKMRRHLRNSLIYSGITSYNPMANTRDPRDINSVNTIKYFVCLALAYDDTISYIKKTTKKGAHDHTDSSAYQDFLNELVGNPLLQIAGRILSNGNGQYDHIGFNDPNRNRLSKEGNYAHKFVREYNTLSMLCIARDSLQELSDGAGGNRLFDIYMADLYQTERMN